MNDSGEITQEDAGWDAEVDRLVESIEAGEQFEAWLKRIAAREKGLAFACRQGGVVPGCVGDEHVSPDAQMEPRLNGRSQGRSEAEPEGLGLDEHVTVV